MKGAWFILLCFAVGVGVGYGHWWPAVWPLADVTLYALYALLFLVGVSIGSSQDALKLWSQVNWKIVLVPLGIVVGSLAGAGLTAVFLPHISFTEGLAVGAGFGYYSLSSVIIGQLRGDALGVVALLSNIMREMMTLLLTPWLVRYFGRLAPIAAGGATAMDTTLPVITRFAGSHYALIAMFSGLVLTVLVPFLVTVILS